jgi:hypothetical protein
MLFLRRVFLEMVAAAAVPGRVLLLAILLLIFQQVLGDCELAMPRLSCTEPITNWTSQFVGVTTLNLAAINWTPSVDYLREYLPDLQVCSFPSLVIIAFLVIFRTSSDWY